MKKWKRWLWAFLGVSIIICLGYVSFFFLYLDTIVDYWWFDSLGYKDFFFLRISYRYLILAGVTLFTFCLFFFNFWIASRYLGTAGPADAKTEKPKRLANLKVIEMFRTGSMVIYGPLSLVLGIFIAIPLFDKWDRFLFYVFAPNAGITDPVYGNDVSFYLFSYPIYLLLQNRLMVVFMILLTASAVLYLIERRMLYHSDLKLPRGAKIHLNFLALILIFLFAWGYLLKRYGLLYDTRHMPLFFGPGYTQMHIQLPLIWVCLVLWLLGSLSILYFINFRKGRIPVIILSLLFTAATWLGQAKFLPDMVQKYLVIPNELSREKPYIQNSVAATLAAYQLTDIETRQFKVEQLPWTDTAKDIDLNIQNIPVWDRNLLDDVYDQLQGIRPYYNFTGVDVDRYTVEGSYQQVNLAGRELNLEKLPEYARNWINQHLQYTHGYGMVMTPAAQSGEEFMIWYNEGIKPRSQYGIKINQPAIYYGLGNYTYAIAPNEMGEIDYPEQDSFVTSNYEGSVGVPLSSLFRKLLFAVYFKDKNIFFTTKTVDASKILFRRNFQKAVNILTPFLTLDHDPYIVVTDNDLFWIQDAYTTSGRYPNAASFGEGKNYIRNSVKIVLNAYEGTIDYYISDPKDPIIRSYDRMYPGLLKPLAAMPGELKKHIRYPKDIFKIQMEIYAKYHQTNPETFYQQEDIWEFAKQPKKGERHEKAQTAMDPYYLTLNLIEKNQQEFLLLAPMCPKNRPNLRALAIAGCDKDHYGKFYVYSFPKGEQVYGPDQISALIDQDTTIAEQFTLWDQVGSEVKRGRMIILPIGNEVFYIQPVYLSASTRLKIPQLQRLIVSQGDLVAMEDSLEKAFLKIKEELKLRIKWEERPTTDMPKSETPESAPETAKTVAPGEKAFPPKAPTVEPDVHDLKNPESLPSPNGEKDAGGKELPD